MDDKKQTTQLVSSQFRSFSAEATRDIRPKPKLPAARRTKTVPYGETEFTASFGAETETGTENRSISNIHVQSIVYPAVNS